MSAIEIIDQHTTVGETFVEGDEKLTPETVAAAARETLSMALR